MTISYSLAPEPIWTLINLQGTVAGGAYLYTYRNLNKVQQKPVFLDAAGAEPWTNPIIFDLNGTQGPFYWEVDSAALDDTYYLEAWSGNRDDPSAGAELLWTLDNFFPPGSGGGGGSSTVFLPLTNYISNNQFIDHIDDMTIPASLNNTVIAPSNHKGFTPALINPVIGTFGALGPDIRFVKNGAANNDLITFPDFVLGTPDLNGDVTPVEYVRYQCTTGNAGETYKAFQFPITQKVNNLSSQPMTFVVWAKVAATPVNMNIFLRQYYGSGTAATVESNSTRVNIGTCALTTVWTKFVISFAVADTSGNSIGAIGSQTNDDAVYLQIGMPLSTPSDVWFTKPALYLGIVNPSRTFDDYDQIDSINQTSRTGDIKTSLLSSAPNGWVAMNDLSIGNVGSGATNRANKDTFQLYKTIWDGVLDFWAPLQNSAGVPLGVRGASAIADFLANNRLVLPRSLGRALAGAGSGSGLTPRVLGQYLGDETISIAAMPSHHHSGLFQASVATVGGGVGFVAFNPVPINTGDTGGSAADGNMSPTSYFNVFIKL